MKHPNILDAEALDAEIPFLRFTEKRLICDTPDREEIADCQSEVMLSRWFTENTELNNRIREQVDGHKQLPDDLQNDDWLYAATARASYARAAARRAKTRMLDLGFAVPYPADDPLRRELKNAQRACEEYRKILKANNLLPERA